MKLSKPTVDKGLKKIFSHVFSHVVLILNKPILDISKNVHHGKVCASSYNFAVLFSFLVSY